MNDELFDLQLVHCREPERTQFPTNIFPFNVIYFRLLYTQAALIPIFDDLPPIKSQISACSRVIALNDEISFVTTR